MCITTFGSDLPWNCRDRVIIHLQGRACLSESFLPNKRDVGATLINTSRPESGNSPWSPVLSLPLVPGGDQLTRVFASTLLRGNIITPCRKDTKDLSFSLSLWACADTKNKIHAIKSLSSRRFSFAIVPVSREQVEIKARSRAKSFWKCGSWHGAETEVRFKEREWECERERANRSVYERARILAHSPIRSAVLKRHRDVGSDGGDAVSTLDVYRRAWNARAK